MSKIEIYFKNHLDSLQNNLGIKTLSNKRSLPKLKENTIDIFTCNKLMKIIYTNTKYRFRAKIDLNKI